VRGDGAVVTRRATAEAAQVIEIEFADGRMVPGAAPPPRRPRERVKDGGQGDLF